MTLFRDFFRRRRLAKHLAENGWTFDYHGVSVTLPEGTDLAVANALIKGKYEAEEAHLIAAHMPAAQPVIELGGSLGVVSGFIRSKLAPSTRHVIVEANPNLIDTCTKNAGGGEVVHAALSYQGDWATLEINDNPHASAISKTAAPGARTAKVPTTTLAKLYDRIGAPSGFTLVCDIEGTEVEMIDQDGATLAKAGTVIMELHPGLYPDQDATTDRICKLFGDMGFALVEKAVAVYVWTRPLAPSSET